MRVPCSGFRLGTLGKILVSGRKRPQGKGKMLWHVSGVDRGEARKHCGSGLIGEKKTCHSSFRTIDDRSRDDEFCGFFGGEDGEPGKARCSEVIQLPDGQVS